MELKIIRMLSYLELNILSDDDNLEIPCYNPTRIVNLTSAKRSGVCIYYHIFFTFESYWHVIF